ncbi:MAG: 1-acyl-sn-glycerol-3-phosphate acyltransferase [Gammaproteobacteria bacterium]|nr:1-acyl-sn-glycerol-3-phosphate acyltransferase [Gammaproteobacteria bacterium]
MLYYIARFTKFIILWLDFILLTMVLYLLTFFPKRVLDLFYPRLFRFWCKVFVHALGVDLRLHQKNRYALPARYLLIANHPSAFEDIGIPALFPVYSLAKVEVRDWWFAGRISWAAGTLYVQRESRESRKAAADQIGHALLAGKNIALYPEGGCKGRRLHSEFKHGAFDISLRTGIPIVPVFLHYEAQDDFEWRDPQTLLHKLWHFMRTVNSRVNYYVFDAIDPKQFKDKDEYNQYVYKLYLQWQAKYLE